MQALSSKDKKFYLVVLGTLVIMLGFGFLPPFGQITPYGMRVLGLFLGCIFAWVFGEVVWSSIFGLVFLTIFGYSNMNEAFVGAYANPTIAITITSFVFCYAIQECGLLNEVAKWIVSQKWAQKSPWLVVMAFLIAAAVSSMMTANMIASAIVLWALFYELARETNVKPHDPYAIIIICGVMVSACMGAATMPYTGMPVMVKGLINSVVPEFEHNMASFFLLNVMLNIVFIALAVIVCRLLFGRKVHVTIPKRDTYKMRLNSSSKIALTLLIIIILCLVVPNFLAADNPIRVLLNNQMSVPGIFMLGSAILMIIHVKERPVLDIVEGIKNVPWPLVLLISSALYISDFITSDETGVVQTIVAAINPIMEGKSAFVVTIMFIGFGLILTNFINDMVTIAIIVPIAAQFILGAGGNIALLAILFGQASVQGCLMPSGSAMGAMLHGNTEWVTSKEVIMYVGLLEILVLISLMIVTLFGGMIGI